MLFFLSLGKYRFFDLISGSLATKRSVNGYTVKRFTDVMRK